MRAELAPARVLGSELERTVQAFLVAGIDNDNTRAAYAATSCGRSSSSSELFKAERLADLTMGDLLAFRMEVMASNLSPSWKTVGVFALRGFLTWANDVIGLPFALVAARKALRVPKATTLSPPAVLTEDEAAAVRRLAPRGNGLHAMVLLLLGAGLRVAELCGLDRNDVVRPEGGEASIRVRGKRSKVRVVPLRQPVVAAIDHCLELTGRRREGEGSLLLRHDAASAGRTARRIGVRSARRRVNRLLRGRACRSR